MAFFHGLQESAFTDWFLGSPSVLQIGSAIPPHRLQPLYRFIWIGFAINLLSGLVLFVTEAAGRVVDPIFYVKIGSIAIALAVGGSIAKPEP